jgi:glycosyltransferase involved in cell wall biosynthesis
MRVGFDVSALEAPPGAYSRGLVRVVRGLVEALERRGRLELVRLAPARGAKLRAWRQGELARAPARLGLAGIHSCTSAFPWRGAGKRVHTVHELPWRHGVGENADLRHRFWATLGTRRAQRTLVPSEHVARDLARGPLVAAAKIRVVPWGVEARFAPEPPPSVIDEALLGRYRLGEEPFVLCPGAVRAKKDLAAVLHALAERRRLGLAPLRVLVTGGETAQLRSDLGLASRLGLARWVSTIDEIAEEDLPGLYRLARAVPALSRSEGFCFPVLEALACATPVLVPPGSAQAELAGPAGIPVDSADPHSVALGLERALFEREPLRAPALERARPFTWDAAAEAVERLWAELG